MAKEKKAARPPKKKAVITLDERLKMKATLKGLKAAKDEALTAGDKKKIKTARTKLKKLKRKICLVTAPPAPPKVKEAAPAEGAA